KNQGMLRRQGNCGELLGIEIVEKIVHRQIIAGRRTPLTPNPPPDTSTPRTSPSEGTAGQDSPQRELHSRQDERKRYVLTRKKSSEAGADAAGRGRKTGDPLLRVQGAASRKPVCIFRHAKTRSRNQPGSKRSFCSCR